MNDETKVWEVSEIGQVIDQNEFAYLIEFPARVFRGLLYRPYRLVINKQVPLDKLGR